jgi:hypothetical protein
MHIRSKYFLIAWLIILCTLIIPSAAIAEDNTIKVLESSTEIAFPASMVFKISAQSPSQITRLRLNYKVDRMNYAEVIGEVWPSFSPSQNVEASWSWDMRRFSLPPFTSIEYWWKIENKDGGSLTTDPAHVVFEDLRYNWQSITQNNVTLYWYKGSQSFATDLLDSALEAIQRLTSDTGTELHKIDIYIYNGSADLQNALIAPREWTGGVAFTEYSKIAIGITPDETVWGKSALAHELGHLVVNQLTYSPYGRGLPVWIDEGLAMHAEGETNPYFQSHLDKAKAENRLISLRSLNSPFSAQSDEAILSYAQSHSIMEFLIQNYGNIKMLQLLSLFKTGGTCDDALREIYGFDQDGLEVLWLESISNKSVTVRETSLESLHPAFASIIAALATALACILALGLEEWFNYRLWGRKKN